MNIVKFLRTSFFIEHLRWLLLSPQEVFCKKVFLEISQNSQENTKKRKKKLRHRFFPVNFAKFIRTAFLTEYLQWLLLCMLYPILYPFSHILLRPLTGYLPLHFLIENMENEYSKLTSV